ncbi:MAG: phage holin family protein [Bacteroidota bacterium]|nr:phage holin family protein [Bacteroidota bacterium]
MSTATADYSRYSRYIRVNEDRPDVGVFLEAAKDDAIDLVQTEKDLAILTACEKVGSIAGKVGAGIVGIIFGMLVLILLSVALGIALGNLFNDTALGFVAAAGVYILMGIIFMAVWNSTLKDKLTLSIINAIHEKV